MNQEQEINQIEQAQNENQSQSNQSALNDVLLDVKDLQVSFRLNRKKVIQIVRGVDLKIRRGQIVGLVGESGSGKSVTSKSILNINQFDITDSKKMVLHSQSKTDPNQIETIDLANLKPNQ